MVNWFLKHCIFIYDDNCVDIIISLGVRGGGRLVKRGCVWYRGGVFVKKGVGCDRTLRILSSNAPGINQNQQCNISCIHIFMQREKKDKKKFVNWPNINEK